MPELKEIFDNPDKIRTWALYATSVLERGFGLKNTKEELDNLYLKLMPKVVGDDQKYAINYFYNYRKMELDMPYDKKYIGDVEANRNKKQIKEAIGFKPDITSRSQSQVKLIMNNLEQALEYLQGNAFVKSYDEDTLERIMVSSGEAMNNLNDMMQAIDLVPDTKGRGKIGFEEGLFSHPGRTGMTKGLKPGHEKEEDSINFSKDEMDTLHDTGEIEKDGHNIKYKTKEDLKKAAQYYKDPNTSEDIKAKLAEYIKQNYKKMSEGTCGYGKDGKLGDEPAGPHLITKDDLKEIETDEVVYKIKQAKELGILKPEAIDVIKDWIAHGGKESYPAIIDFINNLIPEE